MPALCLGEALVDLICEHPAAGIAEARAFVPHPGGAAANVAVAAARAGAAVALAGGAGADAWGRWLRGGLEAEGVDTSWFVLVPGAPTPLALVVADHRGEPAFHVYGAALGSVAHALGDRLEHALDGADALLVGSNTLVDPGERAVTMRARALALSRGLPVVVDVNLRPHRWPDAREAVARSLECLPGALLVRANRAEAAALTGHDDPARAAGALVEMGARNAVVTAGPGGAVLRGERAHSVPGRPARVLSTAGAGDVLTGVLLAALQQAGFDPAALRDRLDEAVAESARATERWSALG